uniref:Transmembrane protein 252 n=1 Tax=Phasianus colchicus TaxID=9054 RepID=A0A669QUR7_PHACC
QQTNSGWELCAVSAGNFSIICLGILCIYTRSSACRCGNSMLVAYCLLALGLLLLVTGVFWSMVHEAMKYGALRDNSRFTMMHFILVCCFSFRPDFYPPSYEDSTDPEKQTFPLPVASAPKEQEVINIPPPLYSESSTESVSETNEPEQPPPYELSCQVLSPVRESDACAPSQDSVC